MTFHTASRWSQRRLRLQVCREGFGLADVTGGVAQLLIVRCLVSAQPTFPLLIVDSKGWLGLHADGQKSRFSLYGALNTKRWTGYDSAGLQWHVLPDSFPYPDAWWTRLLANTIYNPRFDAELHWAASGGYAFGGLQTLICQLVDKDDDILTQFVEADEIKAAVGTCKTFDELIRMLKSMKIVRR